MLKLYYVQSAYVYLTPKCYKLLEKQNFRIPYSLQGTYDSIVYLSEDLLEIDAHYDEYPWIDDTRGRVAKRLKILNLAFYKVLKLNARQCR